MSIIIAILYFSTKSFKLHPHFFMLEKFKAIKSSWVSKAFGLRIQNVETKTLGLASR